MTICLPRTLSVWVEMSFVLFEPYHERYDLPNFPTTGTNETGRRIPGDDRSGHLKEACRLVRTCRAILAEDGPTTVKD